jgi:hypothetical protein
MEIIEFTTKELDAMWDFLEIAFVQKRSVVNMTGIQRNILLSFENSYEKFYNEYQQSIYKFFFDLHNSCAATKDVIILLIEDRTKHSLSRAEMIMMKDFLEGKSISEEYVRPIFMREFVGKENLEPIINELIRSTDFRR